MTQHDETPDQERQPLSVEAIQATAAYMLPFYRKIARSRSYAERWCRAVRKADLTTMRKLLQITLPSHVKLAQLSSNGIGYFTGFAFPYDHYPYINATSIKPGQVQFTFRTSIFRAIARDILRLYAVLVRNKSFASKCVHAMNHGHSNRLKAYISKFVPSCSLRRIEYDADGISLGFKFPSSRHIYYNQFYREQL